MVNPKSAYNRLIEQGIPPEQAVEYIAKNIGLPSKKKEPAPEIPLSVGSPGRNIQNTSTRRVIAHTLLRESYKAWILMQDDKYNPQGRGQVAFGVDYLLSQVAANFRNHYILEPHMPASSTLRTLLSDLRVGKMSHMPLLDSRGPVMRKVDGIKKEMIFLTPRNFIQDQKKGILEGIPAWVTSNLDKM